MTEFEIAQLELMEVARAQGLLELVQGQGTLMQTDSTGFTTLLFGYLLVAYFIGAQLTRVQVSIFNMLYIFSIGSVMYQLLVNAFSAMAFLERFYEISENTRGQTSLNPTYLAFGVILGCLVVSASLYFMWTVRRPKTE